MVEVLDRVNVADKKGKGTFMKADEKKKKFVMGIVIYTASIMQFTILTVMGIEERIWLLIPVAAGIYLPLAIMGQNLMLRQRWF